MFDGPTPAWHASLDLRVRAAHGCSRLSCRHAGPLRVQKALYPEGDSPCHAILLHPPGGIAGGDALDIALDVGREAGALVTTPGAAKWYKANGRIASQRVRLSVAGALEWLPQEAIVFDAADVRSTIDIDVADDARMIGWDIIALGRHAAGEAFASGCFAQTIRLRVAEQLAWLERTRVAGSDPLLQSPIGLDGCHVFGCLWAVGPTFNDATVDALCSALSNAEDAAPITALTPRVLVARARGRSTAAVRSALIAVWRALRPLIFERPAVLPRLWAT
jgi:urease accessory protein